MKQRIEWINKSGRRCVNTLALTDENRMFLTGTTAFGRMVVIPKRNIIKRQGNDR